MKKYISIETSQIKTYNEWNDFYKSDIDKNEYQDFSVWWTDMMRCSLIEEVDILKEITLDNEKCYIIENDNDDYTIIFDMSDYSFRGTLEDIKEEFLYHTNKNLEL